MGFYGDLWDFMVILLIFYGVFNMTQSMFFRKISTIAGHRSTTGGMIT